MSDRHELGDAPIEADYAEKMKSVARNIDTMFNGFATGDDRKVGFCLMVFPFAPGGQCNYMSNASRADIIELLKEQLVRFQRMPEVKPGRKH